MCEIKLEKVSFTYQAEKVLEDVTLTISSGEFVVMVGPNGGGKSTLIKLLAGLLTPTQGTILINGKPIREAHKQKLIGYVPQNYRRNTADFPATVAEVVALGLLSGPLGSKIPDAEKRHIVLHTLDLVGLAALANCRIGDLSGGQQQRVMVARALTGNPSLLFLDEPTSGVDIQASEAIHNLLRELNERLNMTVVLVSHDIEQATAYATHVACINKNLCFYGERELFRTSHLTKNHLWYYST
ncbi:MAG: ABC transporter ATP-binding protein [Sporomusaceae bacterium]|nr:ABC transporter ATP-binding protein [Sporomusaceae bacterium]